MSETKNEQTNMSNEVSKKNPLKSLNLKVNFKVLVTVFGVLFLVSVLYLVKGVFIAAIVNNRPVTRLAVIAELEKQGGTQVLDTLVTKELIYGEINKKGIKVTEEEVNAEIKNIENSLMAQGTTLEQALASQNLSKDKLAKEIKFNKQIEKLVADKVSVSDQEVDQYITENKASFPKDTNTDTLKPQIKETIRQQKLSTEVQALLQELKAKAKIWYWVRYN